MKLLESRLLHTILAASIVHWLECKPVNNQDYSSPIADVDWSELDDITNLDEIEHGSATNFGSTLHVFQPLSQTPSKDDNKNKKKKKVPLTDAQKAKSREYKRRYFAKLDADPVKKQAVHQRRLELYRIAQKRRNEAMTEEERQKHKKKSYIAKKITYEKMKINTYSGFSSHKAFERHKLKELEANGKANEEDLAKLNEIRRIDRESKRKQYQRTVSSAPRLSPRQTQKFKKGKKD